MGQKQFILVAWILLETKIRFLLITVLHIL